MHTKNYAIATNNYVEHMEDQHMKTPCIRGHSMATSISIANIANTKRIDSMAQHIKSPILMKMKTWIPN